MGHSTPASTEENKQGENGRAQKRESRAHLKGGARLKMPKAPNPARVWWGGPTQKRSKKKRIFSLSSKAGQVTNQKSRGSLRESYPVEKFEEGKEKTAAKKRSGQCRIRQRFKNEEDPWIGKSKNLVGVNMLTRRGKAGPGEPIRSKQGAK